MAITKITDRTRGLSGGRNVYIDEYRGLSSDVKPVADNGDLFYEMDTQRVFMFDETNKKWIEQ